VGIGADLFRRWWKWSIEQGMLPACKGSFDSFGWHLTSLRMTASWEHRILDYSCSQISVQRTDANLGRRPRIVLKE